MCVTGQLDLMEKRHGRHLIPAGLPWLPPLHSPVIM